MFHRSRRVECVSRPTNRCRKCVAAVAVVAVGAIGIVGVDSASAKTPNGCAGNSPTYLPYSSVENGSMLRKTCFPYTGNGPPPGAPIEGGSSAPVIRAVSAPAGGGGGNRAVVDAAMSQIGVKYSWGGGGPGGPSKGQKHGANTVGYDCSGLTEFAWARAGVDIPGDSRSQNAALKKVALGSMVPGDIAYKRGHVAIFIGDGKVVEAQQTGTLVKVSNMAGRGFLHGLRP